MGALKKCNANIDNYITLVQIIVMIVYHTDPASLRSHLNKQRIKM